MLSMLIANVDAVKLLVLSVSFVMVSKEADGSCKVDA